MTADRRHQIIQLLATRHDHLPDVSRVELPGAPEGFKHDVLAPAVCPTCDGVDDRCTDCRGRGWVEKRRGRDPMSQADGSVVPPVMRKVTPYGLRGEAAQRHKDLERAQRAAEQELRRFPGFRPSGLADELAEANEREISWLEHGKRYGPLERALDGVRRVDEQVWRALTGMHVWSPMFEIGVRALDRLLPARLAVPAERVVRRVGEPRDDRIVRLVLAEGVPVAEVAGAEGLSVSQVNRIVKRASERSAA